MAMSSEESTAVVRCYWEKFFNRNNLDVAEELFASEHVLHSPAFTEERRGFDAVKAVVTVFHQVSPDFKATIKGEIVDGDKVVTPWTGSGTLSNEIKRAGRSGDRLAVSGVNIFRVSDGKIQETWQWFGTHRDESEMLVPQKKVQEVLHSDSLISDALGGGEHSDVSLWFCYYFPRLCLSPSDGSSELK